MLCSPHGTPLKKGAQGSADRQTGAGQDKSQAGSRGRQVPAQERLGEQEREADVPSPRGRPPAGWPGPDGAGGRRRGLGWVVGWRAARVPVDVTDRACRM